MSEGTITQPNPEALDASIRQRLMSVTESALAPWTAPLHAQAAEVVS
ncbi:MAG: hypothetical protein VYE22_31855 [Myxococcota bacterium]|nr:hypothetical protein [Myxococcota bacterium]